MISGVIQSILSKETEPVLCPDQVAVKQISSRSHTALCFMEREKVTAEKVLFCQSLMMRYFLPVKI